MGRSENMKSQNLRRGLAVSLTATLLASLMATVGVARGIRPAAAAASPWTIVASANDGYASIAHDVSCVNSSFCAAAGFSGHGTFIQMWNGNDWLLTSSPNPVSGPSTLSALLGVSCVSSSFCVAVGGFQQGASPQSTLIEHWDGSVWSIVQSPNIDRDDNVLSSVSCSSISSCVAVGWHFTAGFATRTLVEKWDGVSWNIAVSPNPSTTSNRLIDVSCVASGQCVAVGEYTDATPNSLALVEIWNGTVWSTKPTTDQALLTGVSCFTATSCVAVGYLGQQDYATIANWNGTALSIVSTPALGTRTSYFSGVSCAGPSSCVAVGASDAGPTHTLIDTFDGTAWTVTPAPDPNAFNFGSTLTNVSCTSAGACMAVGANDASNSLVLTNQIAVPRKVAVSWTATEDARLQQIASYLGQTPQQAQKTAVYLVSYLLGFAPRGRLGTPILPPTGHSATYTTVWDPNEFSVIDTIMDKYTLNDDDATRFAVYLLDFLLGLGGH